MLALFSSGSSFAEEYGQIVVDDPSGNTQIILAPGDRVNHIGRGPAILVSQVGNSFTGEDISIRADGTDTGDTPAVLTRYGGVVFLSNSTVETIGTGSKTHALYARDTGSSIAGTGVTLSTEGTSSHGAMAQAGGKIILNGGTITTAGTNSDGLHAKDAKASITAKNVTIMAAGKGAFAGPGASIRLDNSTITVKGSANAAVYAEGTNALITLKDTDVFSVNGPAVIVRSGAFDMNGGTLTAKGDAIRLMSLYNGTSPVVYLRNAKLVAGGIQLWPQYQFAKCARCHGERANQSTRPLYSGAWLPSAGTSLTASRFDIRTLYVGIDNRAGKVLLDEGILATEGNSGHALYVAAEAKNQAATTAKNVKIETSGSGAVGALARFAGSTIGLEDVVINTYGDNSHALYATGSGATLTALNSAITTSGASAAGLFISNSPTVSLNNVQLTSTGAKSQGIWSYATSADFSNEVSVTNGSRIDTQDGVGLFANGGNHRFILDSTNVTARTEGGRRTGILLYSKSANITSGGVAKEIETGTILLDAKNSQLTGDILIDSGSANLLLAKGSQLLGAVNQREKGLVNRFALDNDSYWYVRNSSLLGALENDGTVAFLAPTDNSGFKTVTVNHYRGNGTLVLNTWLGDDNSLTDRLVIDGGTAEGKTALRVINAGGTGGYTQRGIRLVETLNGGTTGVDAFRLDAASTGYRAGTATLWPSMVTITVWFAVGIRVCRMTGT